MECVIELAKSFPFFLGEPLASFINAELHSRDCNYTHTKVVLHVCDRYQTANIAGDLMWLSIMEHSRKTSCTIISYPFRFIMCQSQIKHVYTYIAHLDIINEFMISKCQKIYMYF